MTNVRGAVCSAIFSFLMVTSCQAQESQTGKEVLASGNSDLRMISGILYGVNDDGHRIVSLPAGRSNNEFALYDIDSHKLKFYKIPETDSEITAIQISRDGKKIYAIIHKHSIKNLNGKIYVEDAEKVVEIEPESGVYAVLNSHAYSYGSELQVSKDGNFLFYSRSINDAQYQPGDPSGITKYTHRYFFCCSYGRYVAKYDLINNAEDIIGPVMAPQGGMLNGIQVTEKNIYFYAFGITKAVEYNYNPLWSFSKSSEEEIGKKNEYEKLYSSGHPGEIEEYAANETGFLNHFLFYLPVDGTVLPLGGRVKVVRLRDVGLTSELEFKSGWTYSRKFRDGIFEHFVAAERRPESSAMMLDEFHPKFSDTEDVILFGNQFGGCWGRLSSERRLSCIDYLDGQGLEKRTTGLGVELSHDGRSLVFLTQGVNGDGIGVKGSDICVVAYPSSLRGCHWLSEKDFTATTLTLKLVQMGDSLLIRKYHD